MGSGHARLGRGPGGFDVTGFACAGGELSALGVGWRMKMPMHNDYIIPWRAKGDEQMKGGIDGGGQTTELLTCQHDDLFNRRVGWVLAASYVFGLWMSHSIS